MAFRSKRVTKMIEGGGAGSRGIVPSANTGYRDTVYNNYLDALNPREDKDVQLAMAASTDVRFQHFLELIHGLHKHKSLAAVAKMCDISMAEFMDWVGKAHHAQALLVAQRAMPKLNEHLVEDALNKDAPCDRCDGLGFITIGAEEVAGMIKQQVNRKGIRKVGKAWVRQCPLCNGTGATKIKGDSHARDKLLDMTGLVAKKSSGGPAVVVNLGGHGLGAATDRLNQISFAIEDEAKESGAAHDNDHQTVDVLPAAADDSQGDDGDSRTD